MERTLQYQCQIRSPHYYEWPEARGEIHIPPLANPVSCKQGGVSHNHHHYCCSAAVSAAVSAALAQTCNS